MDGVYHAGMSSLKTLSCLTTTFVILVLQATVVFFSLKLDVLVLVLRLVVSDLAQALNPLQVVHARQTIINHATEELCYKRPSVTNTAESPEAIIVQYVSTIYV